MNSLTLRRSIRGRSIEFTRLLILSMLEDATDTFSVTLSLLNSELGQCNLNADQFLQHLTRLLDELRTKIKNNKEEEDLLNSSSFLVIQIFNFFLNLSFLGVCFANLKKAQQRCYCVE